MQKKKNTRVIVLAVLTVLSAIFYFVVSNPLSPLANVCEDVDYAKEQYANKNVKQRNKFIVLRNNHCKVLLSERKDSKDIYKKIENCSILDYAVEASDKFIDLKKEKDPSAVKDNIKFFEETLESYNYCPQYGDVAKKFKSLSDAYNN